MGHSFRQVMSSLKKLSNVKKTKHLKVVDPESFQGNGVTFKCKFIGSESIAPELKKDESTCHGLLQTLKTKVKNAKEHKKKLTLAVSFSGITITEEKAVETMLQHPVHRICYIARDVGDPRAFGYVFGESDGTHRFYAIKTEKQAEILTSTLRQLFQVVFERKTSKTDAEVAPQGDEGDGERTLNLFAAENQDDFEEGMQQLGFSPTSVASISSSGAISRRSSGSCHGNAHGHSNSHNSFVGGAVPYKEAPPPKLSVNLPVTQPSDPFIVQAKPMLMPEPANFQPSSASPLRKTVVSCSTRTTDSPSTPVTDAAATPKIPSVAIIVSIHSTDTPVASDPLRSSYSTSATDPVSSTVSALSPAGVPTASEALSLTPSPAPSSAPSRGLTHASIPMVQTKRSVKLMSGGGLSLAEPFATSTSVPSMFSRSPAHSNSPVTMPTTFAPAVTASSSSTPRKPFEDKWMAFSNSSEDLAKVAPPREVLSQPSPLFPEHPLFDSAPFSPASSSSACASPFDCDPFASTTPTPAITPVPTPVPAHFPSSSTKPPSYAPPIAPRPAVKQRPATSCGVLTSLIPLSNSNSTSNSTSNSNSNSTAVYNKRMKEFAMSRQFSLPPDNPPPPPPRRQHASTRCATPTNGFASSPGVISVTPGVISATPGVISVTPGVGECRQRPIRCVDAAISRPRPRARTPVANLTSPASSSTRDSLRSESAHSSEPRASTPHSASRTSATYSIASSRVSTPGLVIDDPFVDVDPFAGFDALDDDADILSMASIAGGASRRTEDPFKQTSLAPFSSRDEIDAIGIRDEVEDTATSRLPVGEELVGEELVGEELVGEETVGEVEEVAPSANSMDFRKSEHPTSQDSDCLPTPQFNPLMLTSATARNEDSAETAGRDDSNKISSRSSAVSLQFQEPACPSPSRVEKAPPTAAPNFKFSLNDLIDDQLKSLSSLGVNSLQAFPNTTAKSVNGSTDAPPKDAPPPVPVSGPPESPSGAMNNFVVFDFIDNSPAKRLDSSDA